MVGRARTDPIWFAEQVLRLRALPGEPTITEDPASSWELDDWQRDLLEAFADVVRKQKGLPTRVNHEGKRLITVRACQGPGKTFGAALIAHWFGFCFPAMIPVTAPKLDQVTRRMFKEFYRIQQRAIPGYAKLMDIAATKVTWCGRPDWTLVAETASTPENLQGFHGKYILVIVDEASGVPEDIWPVIFGAVSTGAIAIVLMIGNPTKNQGTFAESHKRADLSKDYFRMHVSFENSKRVSKDWVDGMIRMYGEEHPAVKVRCLGEFADTQESQLIAYEWIANASNREWDVVIGDGSRPKIKVSVDVGDGGEDDTVITVAKHWSTHVAVLSQQSFRFPPSIAPLMAADEAEKMAIRYGATKKESAIVVDSIGVGAGTAGALLRKGWHVVQYKGGEGSDDSSKWRNRRVQSYINLRNAFRDGTISFVDEGIEDWPQLEAELCSINFDPLADRVEDIETKAEMLRKGLKSPNCADSLAMQYSTQRPRLLTSPDTLSHASVVQVVKAHDPWSNF